MTKIKNTFKKYLSDKNITITSCDRFLGGMSNYTYHVVVNSISYVVRIANHEGKKFVDYPSEKLHLFLVEPFGITSKTLFYDTTTGIKISEYLPGHNLTRELTEQDYIAVASILHKLHNSPIEGVDYDYRKRLNKYEKQVKSPFSTMYFELKTAWFKEYRANYKHLPVVFTHGDAQRSNIIKDNDIYHLVDFEFSGMNDPFFDIASFGNIDFYNDSLLLLEYYLDRKPTESELRRVMFYRMFQVLQWHIVAKAKDDAGQSEKLHINFKKYSENYLLLAADLYAKIKTLSSR